MGKAILSYILGFIFGIMAFAAFIMEAYIGLFVIAAITVIFFIILFLHKNKKRKEYYDRFKTKEY